MFIPAPDSPALGLDQAVRHSLANSLQRIADRAEPVLPDDIVSAEFIAAIRAHRVHPGVFGRYYDLVSALQNQSWDHASKLWREIADLALMPAGPAIVPLDVESLGEDVERYRRMFTTGLTPRPDFTAPDEHAMDDIRRTVPIAMALLDDVHPAWARELRSLIGQIVAVVPAKHDSLSISGGSSLMLWGAVLVNSLPGPDRISLLSLLAHEATHQLLLGMSQSEPLVTNPVSERFHTELRPTPRPMNALFHSTYVSGRIHALLELAKTSASLSGAERAHAGEMSDLQQQRFQQGCAVILREATLTELGRSLIEEARDVLEQFSAA